MFSSTYRQPVSFALAALGLGLSLLGAPGSAQAAADVLIAVQTCPLAGRDPSQAAPPPPPGFTWVNRDCGITPPGGDRLPTWKTLALMATDTGRVGGGVVATLNCMSRATGSVSAVASVQSAPSARDLPRTNASKLSVPLNFDLCAYDISVSELSGTSGTSGRQALMVVLGQ